MFEIPGYDSWKLASPEDYRIYFTDGDGECDPQMSTVREFDQFDRVITPSGEQADVIGCEWCETNEKRRFQVQYDGYEWDDDGGQKYETDWFYAYDLKLAK
jgi:hypothetical protein